MKYRGDSLTRIPQREDDPMDVKSIEASIEVSGVSLGAIIEGFKAFRSVAMKIMTAHGLSHNGAVDTTRWYPLANWLRCLPAIAKEVGPNVLFDIGESVPRNAKFPDSIVDIDSAMRSNDIAYHMNHRKNGIMMFNPASGVMLDGIGHYGYERKGDEKKIIVRCDNPYPCKLDHGILTAMARRFQMRAAVAHESKECRSKGDDACTYVVTW
jgi:hypothetical protein